MNHVLPPATLNKTSEAIETYSITLKRIHLWGIAHMAIIRVLFLYVYLTARKGNPVVITYTYTYTLIATWADRGVLQCKPLKFKPFAEDISVGLAYHIKQEFQVPAHTAF